MVVISITANLFSVTTTLLSTLSELALYRTLRRLQTISQCRALRRNRTLCIRSQKNRLRAVAWGALALFLVLETVLSVFSDPVTIPQYTTDDCMRVVALPFATQALTAGELGDEARILCRKTDLDGDFFVKEYGANISTVKDDSDAERAVRCEEEELYGYYRGREENRDVQNETSACVDEACVYVIVDGEDLYFSSRPTNEERSQESNKTWFAFLKTRVRFRVAGKQGQEMAMRLAQAMDHGERDEERLRATAFLGLKTDRCVRPDEQVDGRDGTKVVTEVLVGACVIWAATLMTALIAECRCVRKMSFFDMGCEVQWARRSFRDREDGDGAALIRGMDVDGERCVQVVHVKRGEMRTKVDA
ncbi:hypothetical protein FGB62_76g0118 [Gracilaria domingensis]|nr:hypothetical protein FGB62_76g0118 [Gracilaria domingensis]